MSVLPPVLLSLMWGMWVDVGVFPALSLPYSKYSLPLAWYTMIHVGDVGGCGCFFCPFSYHLHFLA